MSSIVPPIVPLVKRYIVLSCISLSGSCFSGAVVLCWFSVPEEHACCIADGVCWLAIGGRVGGVFQKLERTKNEQSLTGGGQKSCVPKMCQCSSFYDIDPPKSFRIRRIAEKQAGF